MTYHGSFIYQLANHLDSGDHAKAVALLYDQAEHFISQSESGNVCMISSVWLQRKARWLIHAANALPELEQAEARVKDKRREIREIDARLLSAVAALRTYVADCASVAAHLGGAYLPVLHNYPVQPKSRLYSYCSPLSYLRSFGASRPPVAYRHKFGKPDLHATIESEDYDHRVFLLVAMNEEWQKYFYECLHYFGEGFKSAQMQFPVRQLLEVSRLNAETGIDGFNRKKAASKIDEARKLYLQREAVRQSIEEPLAEIDYFYECLKPCEKRAHITPLFLPAFTDRFYGRAPIGMPFYDDMHPENILKPLSFLAHRAEWQMSASGHTYSW